MANEELTEEISIKKINDAFEKASKGELKNILEVTYEKLEVHHLIPFNDIFKEWRDNVWKEDLFPDSACSYFNADADESWCNFHLNVARYQKLCKPCHAKETYA